jgi:lysophospholipase L1-like esterase
VLTFRNIDLFITHHVGPATAYNLCSHSSTTKSNEKLFSTLKKINKKRDIVVLAFGEIDCRLHIYNQYMKHEKKTSIENLIFNTIENYGKVIQEIKKAGYSFFVYGIPPASRDENMYNCPFYASKDMRVHISRLFNRKLKEFCEDKNYIYIEFQSKFEDESGLISEIFSEDTIHLNMKAGALIAEEIRAKIDPRP